MDKARIIFCQSNNPIDAAIRVVTRGWPHCGLMTPDNTVIHATFPFVVETRLSDFMERYKRSEIVEYAVDDFQAGYSWIREQIGKPYDLAWCAGYVFDRNWEDEHKWTCSEIQAIMLEKCGTPRFRRDVLNFVTPSRLRAVK